MKQRRLPTLWQNYLLQDICVLGLLFFLFASSGIVALSELRRRYINIYRAEAEKVELTLSEKLQQARAQLLLFSRLAQAQRNQQTAAMLIDFSELYELSPQLKLTVVIKSLSRSQVFPGFSLTQSPVASYLRQERGVNAYSPLLRGFEDSRASIYIMLRGPDEILLGRVNLESLQKFLRQFGSTAQTPVLLVARDGSVLLASDPSLRIPAFPIRETMQAQVVSEPLVLAGQRWIPILTPANSIGATIVTLVPMRGLANDQRAIVILLLLAGGGSGILALLKSRRMRRDFCQPIAQLTNSMRCLEGGTTSGESDFPAASFSELNTIQSAFRTMAQAISEREQQLRHRASIDELTGLLSRSELMEQLQQLLSKPERRRQGESLALLFCDLDSFKEINDSLGHATGDAVLRAVAERLHSCLRTSDLGGRMGGDEMVVVLHAVPDLESALAVAKKIRLAIAQPIKTPALDIGITASIGATLARPDEGMDELMARADIAMYEAKQAGRNRVIPIR
ncbi:MULTISPECIES: GGDEF domain-containing protein [unclassified Cyanobium]|uniref:GGDEF domain-containing protein n=1 Tax=unclassified Cyanobium TaxID=2627006 RepID=UPI0020CC2924|nr:MULTISPECIES: GGDEF domain-containing protein [unclassified Cyanobium]MCP9860575.1 GGDEF domain-containing protein [Cyanobium sp. Cruz-8H5]MCP9867803.1 GGDEF domain-containing protein [Cyanobium sp. Cruz-8D1]